jgi:hypothetical protein
MNDMTQDFDGPIVEAVKGVGDVMFARMTMADWSTWANQLKQKRIQQLQGEISKTVGLNALAKIEANARAQAVNVLLIEVLDQQYTPDGIAKILQDSYVRAGGEAAKWPGIANRIGPQRQQQLASDICSEPKPTTVELREALREIIRKAKKQEPMGINTMSDDELIACAREFTPDVTEEGSGPLASLSGGGGSSMSEASTERLAG